MKSLYLRSALWDFALVFAASAGLCYTVLNCFYVAADLQYGPVPACVCAAVLLALFAVAANKRTARMGGAVLAAALVATWVAAAAFTPDGAYLVDNEQNYLIFAMCTTLCAVSCFLLSRGLTGSALLFIAGSFLAALVQFLYGHDDTLWAIVFVVSSLALIVFKNYQISLRSSDSVRSVAFAPGFAAGLCMAAVAAGLGCAAWFCVIAPLDPPAAEVKLVTEYRALETVQVKGVADIYQVPNTDMTSDELNDDERTTGDIKESEGGRPFPATGNADALDQPEDADSAQGSSFAGINLDVPDDLFDFLSFEEVMLIALVVCLALALAATAYFLIRRHMRNRRLNRLRDLSPAEQVRALYPYLVSRFEKLGYGIAEGQTLADYATANAASMEAFDEAAGTSFSALTEDYAQAAYGGHELGEDAAGRIASYYGAFWKACRKKLGGPRYVLKSFKLG